jgi:hypothetical protein
MAEEAFAALALVCKDEEQERAFASTRTASIGKYAPLACCRKPFNKYAYYLDTN